MVNAGDRMFVGTAEGSLTAYECRGDTTNALKARSFECREVWNTRARPFIPLHMDTCSTFHLKPCRFERLSLLPLLLLYVMTVFP